MRKPTIEFNWHELHENEELQPVSSPSNQYQSADFGRKRQVLFVAGGAICLLMVALLGAIWVMRQAKAGMATIHNELVLAVDAEVWHGRSTMPPASTASGVVAMAQTGEEVLRVELQALQQDMAAVMVVTQAYTPSLSQVRLEDTTQTHAPPVAYRRLRFYRRTTQGWQPAAPIPALWGNPQHLTTEYFEFTYRTRDAQTVQAVAAELDALYAQVRLGLGLPLAPARKIAIEVVIGEISIRQVRAGERSNRIILASPALLPAPDWLSDAAILRQSILLALVDRTIQEAVSVHSIPPHWYPLLTPARLWLIWDAGGPLAAWREPMLRWLYMDLHRFDNIAAPVLPGEYMEICTLYSLWEGAPLQMGAFPLCHAVDQVALHPHTDWETLSFMDFIRMKSAHFFVPSIHNTYNEQTYGNSRFDWVLPVALLDYTAAAYGRERIVALWNVLHEHEDWETLIPVVFGVSTAEFEAGWQAYVTGMIDD